MQAQKFKNPVELLLFAKTISYIVILNFIVKNLCWEMFSVLQYHTSRQYGKILFYDMQKSPTEKNENDILKYIPIALWCFRYVQQKRHFDADFVINVDQTTMVLLHSRD